MPSVLETAIIRVLCEACLKEKSFDCIICDGNSFYFWDPETSLCYDHKRMPLEVENDAGEKVSVVRQLQQRKHESETDLASMLSSIERWVTENPIRKWKLWVDCSGWHSSVWFNRYKKQVADCSSDSLTLCVAAAYEKIFCVKKRSTRKRQSEL